MSRGERILVLHNEPVLPESHPDSFSEVEVLESVEAVAAVLAKEGYEVRTLGVSRDPGVLIDDVKASRPDAVFNLFEGTPDHYLTEVYLAGLLDWLDVPFTGCPAPALMLAQQKHMSKRLFQQAGVPTAPFVVVDSADFDASHLRWPLMVKPAAQDSSVGIDQSSVVTDADALHQRVRYILESYGGPVLVEEFIAGRELTIGIVELPDVRLLPITEVTFLYKQPDVWPILSYNAKWESSTFEYQETDYLFDVQVEPALRQRLHAAAMAAFRLVGGRDYARADFRVRGDEVFLLEMNPNPSFAPERGLTWALGAAGVSHREFTLRLTRNALERGRRRPAGKAFGPTSAA